jgi:hypothetical protein
MAEHAAQSKEELTPAQHEPAKEAH